MNYGKDQDYIVSPEGSIDSLDSDYVVSPGGVIEDQKSYLTSIEEGMEFYWLEEDDLEENKGDLLEP